ncbi:hypothetical protein [Haloferax sp. Atlit-48N]|uniref:Uncharacterized protein n=1 Tax=Haloferax sp. Atlit-48N TaxID=2077198 RepID=A0ACD5HZD1_9EURY|nr:hypothetical protein [Haloferax sp. Atlit-48N]RDZ30231.1 hypothetical protein DEQ67_16725 [Haloferax sp. Atlit-48N]
MSYRHSTDRVDGTMLVECPNDPEHITFEIELSCSESKPSELFLIEECPDCGSDLSTIESVTPTEVL